MLHEAYADITQACLRRFPFRIQANTFKTSSAMPFVSWTSRSTPHKGILLRKAAELLKKTKRTSVMLQWVTHGPCWIPGIPGSWLLLLLWSSPDHGNHVGSEPANVRSPSLCLCFPLSKVPLKQRTLLYKLINLFCFLNFCWHFSSFFCFVCFCISLCRRVRHYISLVLSLRKSLFIKSNSFSFIMCQVLALFIPQTLVALDTEGTRSPGFLSWAFKSDSRD